MRRVRWGSVLAVVALFAIVYLVYNYFPSGYSVSGGVGIWASASPSKIMPGNSTVISVEIKNMDSENQMLVQVRGLSYDDNLFFDNTYSQSDSSDGIMLGPQAVRKISFKMRSKKEALAGRYPVDISALEVGKEEGGAMSRVFIDVEAPKT